MELFVDHPLVVLLVLFVAYIASVAFGAFGLRRWVKTSAEEREDLKLVQNATFTLLALLIGFSLSMAVGRYDQRKNLEEAEANAIGTEYVRADLAGPQIAAPMKNALARYARLRADNYVIRGAGELSRIATDTTNLQGELWRLATQVGNAMPNPIGATIVTGMNDVLNSQDYSEAARINRIPTAAWVLMMVIGVFACVFQGFGASGNLRKGLILTVLPLTIALSLALIADIDSPRGGVIRVLPQNLDRLLHALG